MLDKKTIIYIIVCVSCLCLSWVGGYLYGNRRYNIQYRTIRELQQQLTAIQHELAENNQRAKAIVDTMGEQLDADAGTLAGIKQQLIGLREKIKVLQDFYASSDSDYGSSDIGD